MELSDGERMDLAAALLDSVDHDPADEDHDEAWAVESRRRLDEVRSGAVKPVPWHEAERLIFGPSDAPQDR